MAHLLHIDKRTNEFAFAKHGEPAWHGLGTIVPNVMTSEEAIKLAHLDFEVDKVPMYFYLANGDLKISDLTWATVRTDTFTQLGHVKKDYEVFQNLECFQIVDDIIGDLEAVYESAGALRSGETIFLTAKLPDYFKVGDEEIDQYLVVTNNHSGESSLRIMFTPIVVVCNNTLQMAINGSKKAIVIKHTSKMRERTSHVDKSLGIINQLKEDLAFNIEAMINTPANEQQAHDYFTSVGQQCKELQGKRLNFLGRIEEFYHTGPGQDMECRQNTVWGCYQAITGFVHHERDYMSQASRFEAVLNGTGYNIMNTAKEKAMALCTPELLS